MGGGKKKKNRPRRDRKSAAEPPITNIADTSGDTATTGGGGRGWGSSAPTSEATSDPKVKNKIAAPNCHIVPRWILKNFAWQEGSRRSNDPEINCFDLGKKTLTRRLVSQAYAKKGLFKDPDSAPGSVTYNLEAELGRLEGKASRCFQEIRDAVNSRDKNPSAGATPPPVCIKQKRKYLQELRKFMFVMYYHQLSIGKTYYNKDHPDNAQSQDWIKDYCEKYQLSACPEKMHVWLHVLQHYLRKKHDDLMDEGRKAEIKLMESVLAKLGAGFPSRGRSMARDFVATAKSVNIDPKLEEWKSVPYYNNMQRFLVIWEAAPGEEFLISDNSFGLYEGRTDEAGPLHWIYVISPRIVLVLCHPGLKDTRHLSGFINHLNLFQLSEEDRSMSMLLNAPHPAANVKYKCNPLPSENIFYGNRGAAPAHPDDEFEIQISVLSSEDTHTINAIILGNVNKEGLLTFHSKDAALRTLEEFAKNQEFDHELKLKFAPLAKELSKDPDVRPNIHFNLQRFEPKAAIPPFRLPPLSTEPGTFWETSLIVYHTLHRGHDPQCISYRRWEKMHTEGIKKTVGTGLQLRPARLVSKLDDRVAYILFMTCNMLIPTLFDGSLELEVYFEQLIIGFLDNLLKKNRPLFDMIEEGVIKCLREDFRQSELSRTVKIKEFISPEDDDHVPVPVDFLFHDPEAAAGRADVPPNPAMAYMNWELARMHYIQDIMIPSEVDPPSPPSPPEPEQGKEPQNLDEKRLTDLFAKIKGFGTTDLEQEIKDSIPSHLCVTVDDTLGKEGAIPGENWNLHVEASQGIHSNGGANLEVSRELNLSLTLDVGASTKVEQTVDQKMFMQVDPGIRAGVEPGQKIDEDVRGRARRDLWGVISIPARRIVRFFAGLVLALVVYSACICGTATLQFVETLCLQYRLLILGPSPAGVGLRGRDTSPLVAHPRFIHREAATVITMITIVCGAAFFGYGSLTLVEFCISLILSTANNPDGHECTGILC